MKVTLTVDRAILKTSTSLKNAVRTQAGVPPIKRKPEPLALLLRTFKSH